MAGAAESRAAAGAGRAAVTARTRSEGGLPGGRAGAAQRGRADRRAFSGSGVESGEENPSPDFASAQLDEQLTLHTAMGSLGEQAGEEQGSGGSRHWSLTDILDS